MSATTRIELELVPGELAANWSRCGQTADFLASYIAQDLEPAERAAAKNVLSTVINELVENAVKFSAEKHGVVKVAVRHQNGSVSIETTNAAPEAHASFLEKTLERLRHTAADSLFAERTAAGRTAGTPGIGLIILQRDYDARLRAKLTTRPDGAVDVHLSAELDVRRVTRA